MINCVGSASMLAKYPAPSVSPVSVVGIVNAVDHILRCFLSERYAGQESGSEAVALVSAVVVDLPRAARIVGLTTDLDVDARAVRIMLYKKSLTKRKESINDE